MPHSSAAPRVVRPSPDVIPTPAPPPGRAVVFTVRALLLLGVLAAIPMLWWPMGMDQAIFAVNGRAILDGAWPYRDAWETRGPLAFYLQAFIELLSGGHAWGVRAVDVVIAFATALMLRRLVRAMHSPLAGDLTAAVWMLLVVSLGWYDTAQSDLWCASAVLWAVVLVRADPDRAGPFRVLGAGLLVGLISLLKPFYPALLAVPGLVVLIESKSSRQAFGSIGMLAIGWVLPIVACLVLLVVGGVWPDFVAVHFGYNTQIYAAVQQRSPVEGLLAVWGWFAGAGAVGIALPVVCAGGFGMFARYRSFALALLLWLALGIGFVMLQGKFFPYHWSVLYPPLVLFGASGISALWSGGRSARLVGGTTLTVALIGLLEMPASTGLKWLRYVTGRTSAGEYYRDFGKNRRVNPGDQMLIADVIRTHSSPNDRVGLWGPDAAVTYLAGRRGVSRFPISRWLEFAPETDVTRRLRKEYVEAIIAERPLYFVVSRQAEEQGLQPAIPLAKQFPELAAVIERDYQPERRVGALTLYRRRST